MTREEWLDKGFYKEGDTMSEQSVYGGGVMEPAIVIGGARVFHGDCREILRGDIKPCTRLK